MARAIAECQCSTCGATFTRIEFKHNRSEADGWKAWAEANYDECTACWKARKQKSRDEENANYAAAAAEAALPQLTGTVKQVTWAITIRGKALASLDDFEAEIDEYAYTAEEEDDDEWMRQYLDRKSRLNSIRPWLTSHDKAAWWIDHRDTLSRGNGYTVYRFADRQENKEATS